VASLIGGGLLLLMAVLMFVGFLQSSSQLSAGATVIALGISVVLPGIAGVALLLRHFRSGRRLESRREVLRQQTLESEVLRLAGQRGGRLALVEVVTEMAVSTASAQAALDALVEREIADIAVTDSGVLVYTFRDVEKLGDKSRARGILE
jgi:hypothetical protein